MSVFSVASFSSSFPIVYSELVPQTQRKCPTLRLASDLGRLKASVTGDKMRWVPRFSGQTAQAVNTDGGNLPTAVADDRKEAAQAFGTYAAPIRVTDAIRRLAQSSAGIPPQFNPYDMVVGQNALEAMEVLLKTLNQDLYAGDGTTNKMLGAATAIAATGSYAGVAQSSYSGWASTVQGNSGSLRSVTLTLLKTLLRTVSSASAAGRPNLAFCQSALFDSIENLFTPYTMIPFQPQSGPVQAGTERAVVNPATINIPGGQIKSDGFRVLYWQSANCYFIEDPDASDTGATNANNSIFFLNANEFSLEYPPLAVTQDGAYNIPVQTVQAVEQGMGPLGNLPLEMTARGRTVLAFEWDVVAYLGIKFRSRNAHGKLQDVQ